MNSKQIIAEIESLAPEEREEVMAALQKLVLFGEEKMIEPLPEKSGENVRDVLLKFAGKANGGMPEDMAANHDHYLYGTPKQQQ